MKNILKRICTAALALIICLSFTACSGSEASKDKLSMTNLHKYLSRTEEDVFKYLGFTENDIKSREEDGDVDIVLNKTFNYNGSEADVWMTFAKDHLVIVKYRFKDTENGYSKAAFDYMTEIKNTFDKAYKDTSDEFVINPNLRELTDEQYKKALEYSDNPQEVYSWVADWKTKDKYGLREDLPQLAEDGKETFVRMYLQKSKEDTIVSVSMWIGGSKN